VAGRPGRAPLGQVTPLPPCAVTSSESSGPFKVNATLYTLRTAVGYGWWRGACRANAPSRYHAKQSTDSAGNPSILEQRDKGGVAR
jgi:hypothetical protein